MNSKSEINMLLDIHTTFSKLPISFRETVSEECNWSTPTYYRKIRSRDKPDPNNKGKVISALSKAEKDAIFNQASACYENFSEFMEGLKQKLGK